ncbi:MAG: hypothetical protein FWE69_07825, partial [Clostridiales bacterium]|nr:hypothetical protein [Clostridiales bacterium]
RNCKKLTVFSLIYLACLLVMFAFSFVSGTMDESFALALTGLLFLPMLCVMAFFILSKTELSLLIYIADILNEQTPTVKNAWRRTKGKVARYVGNTLLVGLMMFIPLVVIAIVFAFTEYGQAYTFLITIPSNLLIQSAVFLLSPVIASEDWPGGKLKRAFKLTEGNYAGVLAFVFLTSTLVTAPTVIVQNVFRGNTLVISIVTLTMYLLQIFTYAFAACVRAILYRQFAAQDPAAAPEIDLELPEWESSSHIH